MAQGDGALAPRGDGVEVGNDGGLKPVLLGGREARRGCFSSPEAGVEVGDGDGLKPVLLVERVCTRRHVFV